MQAILFDMDGVLYEGDTPIPGAAEAISWCRNQGIPHRFLTNTSSRSRTDLIEKLDAIGISATVDEILTPPVAALSWLKHNTTGPVALFVPDSTREEFNSVEQASQESTKVAAVVLGDLGEGWDFATYNRAFSILMQNPDATLIALGMTRYWQAEDGLRLDVGPFVKGLEYATGRQAVVMGKPASPFFEAALQQLETKASETVMVGDDVRGDIDGAQQAGLRGIQVRTGKFRQSDLELGITPYAVLDSIATLPAWWCQQLA